MISSIMLYYHRISDETRCEWMISVSIVMIIFYIILLTAVKTII